MFFMVSETKVAQEVVEKVIGNVGRMVEPEHGSLLNISLWTKELGKIWYGDILNQAELDSLKAVSSEIKESIFVLPEWNENETETYKMAVGSPWNITSIEEITAN